ncbi:ABC transporter substrate-binding protein [Variovorax sp. J2P1-59]|uniref:ABC transporter substrate-binding protein n=1 Tax=Variovorax flavidus TaxID=3053501 RepID=UPI00257877D4|nr:ABC transporter substrate-binding protein [Variovorax sp. J2P1-59]MDM0078456.1 ABC transporter substrate-binding protein [Variovorax sp. J2P1-59]
MNLPLFSQRRRFLQGTVGAAALAAFAGPSSAVAQSRPAEGAGPRVTQLLDMSSEQQELSRDYATGIRLAFAELKRGNAPVPQLSTIETDGSALAARNAIQLIKNDPSQVALLGTVGEGLALSTLKEAGQARLDIAHVAPWLADSQFDADARLFGLFASRESQIRYVVKNLATMGVTELGMVYPNAGQSDVLRASTEAISARLQIKVRSLVVPPGQDLALFGSQLGADTPYFLVFMGASIELAQFTRGLSKRGLQRYVVCLADVDTNTFLQLDPGKGVPIIFTQVVPNPHSSKVAVVRAYRDALQRLFDEPPSPVSLAGYLAGRYAAAVLASVGQDSTRARVLAEFQRRRPVDLAGWRVEFSEGGRASTFVSQTLLNAQGAFVG